MVVDLINRYNIIIPAAGSARRLRPLTEKKPKSMLKVAGMSIIERQLNNLPKENVNKVIIVIGHEGEQLIDHVERLKCDFQILYIKNDIYEETNCAYSLICASKFFQDIIIINCDLLFSLGSIQKLIRDENDATVCLRKNDGYQTDLQKALIKNHLISKWSLKLDESNAEIMGPIKLKLNNSQKILNYFNSLSVTDQKKKHCFSLISECIKNIEFSPVVINDNSWYEIDDETDFINASKLLESSKLFI